MGAWQAVLGASVVIMVGAATAVEAGSGVREPGLSSTGPGGIRTDRLSGKDLEKWHRIVDLVRAEDHVGRPLHPTLRRLFESVDSSGHAVFIEMPDTKSYFAGRFEVTHVDPEGRAHEALLLLNLRAIDRASTGPAAARADGFTPFKGLKKFERYAETLGHELAHAVWHLASPERAMIAARLQGQVELQARAIRASWSGSGPAELPAGPSAIDRLAMDLEAPAETAERAIWEELRASRKRR
jgi:hypothetical protein